MTTAAERHAYSNEIDKRATALYDKLNPDWERKINISKDECIRRVMAADKARPGPAKKRRLTVDERRTLHAAFMIVRRDPTEQSLTDTIKLTLGGKREVTDTLLDTARQIIAVA